MFPALAAGPYQQISSEHFDILAPRDPEAVAVLQQLELAHAFFEREAKLHSPHARPVLFFVPATEAQYLRIKPTNFALGFYVALPGRDAIVLQSLMPSFRRAAVHEYTHLAVQYSGGRYPRWLGEGIAEYYSTLRTVGGRVQYGHVLPERVARLRMTVWFSLDEMFGRGIQKASAERQTAGAEREDTFYAQSWLLVHMLNASPQYRDKWLAFRDAIRGGSEEADAFRRIYDRSLSEVAEDLRNYFGAGDFEPQAVTMPVPEVTTRVIPANEIDVEATTAAMEGWRGFKDQARAAYKKLERASEGACRFQRGMGDLAEAAGLFDDALQHRKDDWNCAKGPVTGCDMARNLGMVASPPPALVATVREQLRDREDCGTAFYLLGRQAYRRNAWADAASLLARAVGLPEATQDEAQRMHEDAEARVARGSAAPGEKPTAAPDDTVEILQADDKPPLSRTDGMLERVDCTGAAAKLQVRAKIATFTFYVEKRAAYASLVCGAQSKPVTVGFEQVKLPGLGAVAAVRELVFR